MERETLFADVIVPLGVPNKYTYRVPFEMNEAVQVGKRVLVQFGKSRIYTGIIYRIHNNAPQSYVAKYIETVLDDEPVVTGLQLKFWDWMSFYYCANPGDVMNSALPSGLKLSSTAHIQLNSEFNFEETDHHFFTEREHVLLDALHLQPNMSFDDAARVLNVKSAQPLVHNLIKKNAVSVYEEIREKYKPKLITFYRLQPAYLNEGQLHEALNTLEKKAFRQAEALLYFLQLSKATDKPAGEWIGKNELVKKVEAAALSALAKKGILEEKEFETGRLLFEKGGNVNKGLSDEQQKAYREIVAAFEKEKTVLLHGVTGSGKTEIYIQLIHDELAKNKEVLFLIPEIALTTQLITRLRAVFGETVGVYHSRFSENERVEIWNNVLKNKSDRKAKHTETSDSGVLLPDAVTTKHYRVILGARSSLFLPFHNIGLIIIDEEHDQSFKQQDPSPRYHGRDAALYLASLHGARVLLGSATPSAESSYNALQGKFALVKLHQQFVKGGGTDIEVCDLRFFEQSRQMKTCLSPPLYEAVAEALKKKEQVILFQNRRGFAPYTECKECGFVPHCVQCDVALIYHKQNEKLICHYCGYSIPPPKTCAACGSSSLRFKGMGTEKIEEDIETLFPEAKIARMDLDSTRSKYAYKQLLDDFENGQTDILVGTQMVTKGLDFRNVSVVGAINADAILNFPDFRAYEKAWQMLTQVRGRAGRNDKRGKVFIQTSHPKHFVISEVLKNNPEEFYTTILEDRKKYHYPPYSRLFELSVVSKDLNEVNHLANELALLLKSRFGDQVLGPEFPMVPKIKNQYYKRMLLKTGRAESPATIRSKISEAITELHSKYQKWNFRVQIDVDPV